MDPWHARTESARDSPQRRDSGSTRKRLPLQPKPPATRPAKRTSLCTVGSGWTDRLRQRLISKSTKKFTTTFQKLTLALLDCYDRQPHPASVTATALAAGNHYDEF